jgi:methylthioribose-1-phosphate isomerase
VIVGADRVAANGDVVNKIGTYNLAVLARHHGVRLMAALPISTIDPTLASGEAIPIEQRNPAEVTHLNGQRIAAAGADALNPAFDWTPASLVDAIVTEYGVIMEPNAEKVAQHLAQFAGSSSTASLSMAVMA